ncbi:MAG TPA: aromatic amino acid transport family protein [Chlamydiales bacterium]|nr:aromatic amino acid transport family protein [Chlamydiales bacterium]
MTTISQSREAAKTSSWRGILLVSGTCVGGGMLAMPIQTAEAGFFISFLILLATWIFMTFTGLLLVETTLWLKEGVHFSSMTQLLLGKAGKALSLVLYLFMNVASLVAYTSGGALLIDRWILDFTGISIGYGASCALFTLIFGSIVYLGVAFIGKMNGWFIILMGAIYCYLVGVGFFGLHMDYLAYRSAWLQGLNSFPLIFAAFSYQMIVPSLCSYLNYEARDLKKSVVIGTAIPFAVYFLWLLVIHGVIPFEGAGGLQEAFKNGSMITEPVKAHFNSAFLLPLMDGFAFLALVTSYFGLSIALFDFIKDLFKGISIELSKKWITVLSLVPSLILAICFPRALLDFLDLSGGFGDALLSGLIPVAMVWIGRYRRKFTGDYQVSGGKWSLIIAGSFAFSIFILQWVKLLSC